MPHVIVHVVRQFHPGVGGLENVVRELALTQVKAGKRVRVVTLDRLFNDPSGRKLPAREILDGIEIVRVPFFGSSRYPVAFSALRHLRDADLVHVHAIDFFFDYLAWTKPWHRRTLVVSTHGGFFHTAYAALLKRIWFQTVTRLSLRSYAGVAAVSASDFDRFAPLRQSGLVCIENGVDVSVFGDSSAKAFTKSILSLGRFATNKRLDRLIAFVGALRRDDPDWRLVIAGRPGDLEADDLRTAISDAGLDGAVEVVVSPGKMAIRTLMAKCSLFATASDYEGFGVAAIEAMSAGLVPLLSEISPFQRLHSLTGLGLILDYSDPDTAARRLLQDMPDIASNYSDLRAACIEAAKAYDWPRVYRDYSKLYDAVTGRTLRTLLDVPVQVRTFDDAVELIDNRHASGQRTTVAFANAHTLNVASRNPDFRAVLQDSLVLNDGIGVDIASLILYGSPFPDNLNGTDFSPNYLRATRHRYRVFLLGAEPGTAERAAKRLTSLDPRHEFVGCYHGHFDETDLPTILQRIRRSKADLLLVAMGNPKQELFIRGHLAATGCTLGIGVGALFDFLAGNVPRAKPWMQKWRVEWIYRLAQEPRRLGHRYLVGIPVFLTRIALQFWSGARVKNASPMHLGDALKADLISSSGRPRLRLIAALNATNVGTQNVEKFAKAQGLPATAPWQLSPRD
jgi:alpha-1,3-mannosyltransferase